MLRRVGILLSGFGVAIVGGMLLFLVLDFASYMDIPFTGFAEFLHALHGIQYALAVVLTMMMIIMPVDWYFFIGGTTATRAMSLWVPLYILLFFGIISLMIGFRSKGVQDAILNSYLFILLFHIILLIFIFFTYDFLIGMVIKAFIEGVYGREITMFVILSMVQNGTILAVLSAFIAAILEDKKGADLNSPFCADGDVCSV